MYYDSLNETIVAVSTNKGESAIGIVRMSGTISLDIANTISKKKIKKGINYSSFYDSEKNLIDVGLILFFKSPNSFTGEDVIEFHSHGNDLILNLIIDTCVYFGARLASPGEFSFRSLFYEKIDLLQAESINSLIKSKHSYFNSFLANSLLGKFSKKIELLLSYLSDLINHVDLSIEVSNDYNLNYLKLKNLFDKFLFNFNSIFNFLKIDSSFYDYFNLVILGDVNVGKSSFFNTILKKKRSIVSNIPGTTRDFVESFFFYNDFKFNLIDTAGFNPKTKSILEKKSILNSILQSKKASVILYIFDIRKYTDPFKDETFCNLIKYVNSFSKIFILVNKIDLLNLKKKIVYHKKYTEIFISVKNKTGIDLFLNEIKKFYSNQNNNYYFVNKRIYFLFLESKKILSKIDFTNDNLNISLDIFSEKLKFLKSNILKILGKEYSSSETLNNIFSNFCIGK